MTADKFSFVTLVMFYLFVVHGVPTSVLNRISAKNLQPSDASEEIKDVVSGGEGGVGEVGSTTHTIHNSKEYCEREYFDAKCPEGEAILVRSAVYGRMRPGRCIRGEYGSIGCQADVIRLVDSRCSGRRHCRFHTSDMHISSPCPDELISYLEASYDCIAVTTCEFGVCEAGSFLRVPTSTVGFLASTVSSTSGCGSPSCPWVLTPHFGQRINLTFYNFLISGFDQTQSKNRLCQRLASVVDRSSQVSKDVTVCSGTDSRTVHYVTSESSPVEVRLFGPVTIDNPTYFILRYEAVGCAEVTQPEGGWTKRERDRLTAGCYHVQRTWHLTCNGSSWIGEIGNCATGSSNLRTVDSLQARNFGTGEGSVDASNSNKYGVLLIISIGIIIGIILGFSMLVVAIVLIKRSSRLAQTDEIDEAYMSHLSKYDVTNLNNFYNQSDSDISTGTSRLTNRSGLHYQTQTSYESQHGAFVCRPALHVMTAITTSSTKNKFPPPPPPPVPPSGQPCDDEPSECDNVLTTNLTS